MRKLYFLTILFLSIISKGQEIKSFKSAGTQDQYVPVVFDFVNRPFSISRPSVHQDRNWLGYGIATINGIGYGWGSGNTMLKLENFTYGAKNSDGSGGWFSFIGKVKVKLDNQQLVVYLRGGTTYYTDGIVRENNGEYFEASANNEKIQSVPLVSLGYNIPRGSYIGEWEINASSTSIFSMINSASGFTSKNGNIGIGTADPQYKLDVNGNFRAGDSDSFFSYNGKADLLLKFKDRGSGGRAFVHEGGNVLVLNYGEDFSGGTRLGTSFLVRGNHASLKGKFEASEVRITATPTADFVFEEDYQLPKLEDVEKHIKEKKHLPEIASAKEMEKEGVNMGDFQIKLLQKIEELTLYTIEQNKQLKQQNEWNEEQKRLNTQQANMLKDQQEKILELERILKKRMNR